VGKGRVGRRKEREATRVKKNHRMGCAARRVMFRELHFSAAFVKERRCRWGKGRKRRKKGEGKGEGERGRRIDPNEDAVAVCADVAS